MLKVLSLVFALLVSQFATNAFASDWNGDIDSDWFKVGNWSAGVPTAGTSAVFNDPDPAVIAGAAVASLVNMTDGSLTISSGSLTVGGLSQIGLGAANPSITQDGGDVTWNTGGLFVGSSVGSGADIYSYNGGTFTAAQLTVRADGQFDHNNAASPLVVTNVTVGSTTGAHVFNLNGNEMEIGDTFNFGAAGNTGTTTFNLGDPSTAKLTFTGAAAKLTVNGNNDFVIPAGWTDGLTTPGQSQTGNGDGFANITQNGSNVAWNGGGLFVGNTADGKVDQYNFNAGTFSAAQLTVRGEGEFNHNNAGVPVIVTGAVQIGSSAGDSTFNLNGKELRIGTNLTFGAGGSTGTPTFNFGDLTTAKLTFTGASGALRVNGTSDFVIPAGLVNGITTTGQSITGSGDGFASITQNGADVAFNGGGLFVGTTGDGKADRYNFNGGTFTAAQLSVRADGEFNHNNAAETVTLGGLTLGNSATGNSVFNLNGNHVDISGTFNFGSANNTNTNTFNFGNPATAQLTFTGTPQFNIVGNSTFVVPAGLANAITFPGQSIVGNGAGTSVYQQEGGTVTFDAAFFLANVDNGGGETDQIILNGGTLNFSNQINLRRRGVLTVNGGTLNATSLPIGLIAGYVSGFESTGGTSNFSQTMTVDSVGDSEVDFINVSGGTVNITGAGNDLVMNGTSQATISGGTTNIADDFLIGTLATHTATVDQSGGRVVVGDQLELATVTGSTGTYNLSGGELKVGGILKLNANDGADTFNFSGGKLSADILQLGDGAFSYTGGLLSPGLVGSPDTMTVVGDLIMPALGGLEMDLAQVDTLGGVNDLLQVNGDLTLDGTLSVNALGGLENGLYPLITFTGSFTDNGLDVGTPLFSIVTILNEGGGGTVFLGVVPEPSSAMLLGCGLLGLALRRRKRNR